jgi:hypothetical protein
MSHDDPCVIVAAIGGICSGYFLGWFVARLQRGVPPFPREIRQQGLLYVDRDKAVAKHIDSLRRMARPGNRHSEEPHQ